MAAETFTMLAGHNKFMRSLVSSPAFEKPCKSLCVALKQFVATIQCRRTSDGCIDGDDSSEFVIKGGIDMNFRIFCLLEP